MNESLDLRSGSRFPALVIKAIDVCDDVALARERLRSQLMALVCVCGRLREDGPAPVLIGKEHHPADIYMTLSPKREDRARTFLVAQVVRVFTSEAVRKNHVVTATRKSLANYVPSGARVERALLGAVVKVGDSSFRFQVLQGLLEPSCAIRVTTSTECQDEPVPIRPIKDESTAPKRFIVRVRHDHGCAWHGLAPMLEGCLRGSGEK